MTDEVQLFRVEWRHEGPGCRIFLNDEPIGPLIETADGVEAPAHAGRIMRWFLGYLEERVQRTAARFGGGVVVRAEHVVPEGACPRCGKEPAPLVDLAPPQSRTVIENPCPVCRR